MKHTIFIILFFYSFSGLSQNKTLFSVGIAYPQFFKKELFNDKDYQSKTYISGYNFFLEKSELISFLKEDKFFFTPGISFFHFTESQASPSSALGGWGKKKFEHFGLSLYNKLLFQTGLLNKSTNTFIGVIAGMYLYTKTDGRDWGAQMVEGGYGWDKRYDISGKIFFDKFYYGAILRLEPKNNLVSILKPSLELSYFPYYSRLLDLEESNYEKLKKKSGMLSISVCFSIQKKLL